MDFSEEISGYSDDDLELIIATQKDLYTQKEMEQLIALQKARELEKKAKAEAEKKQKEQEILSKLPDTILCEKCDGPNPFHNAVCNYCGHKLDKTRYYCTERQNTATSNNSDSGEQPSNSYSFHYIISFIIPLIGFIVGAVMLANDDEEKQSCGKACIVLGIISMIINVIVVLNLIG